MRNLITRLIFFFLLVSMGFCGTYSEVTNLYGPSVGEVGYGVLVSQNFTTKIDKMLGFTRGTVPASSSVGDLIYIEGANQWSLSSAASGGTSAVVEGVIFEKISSTDARIQLPPARLIVPGLVDGAEYFLSVTPGEITTVEPVSPDISLSIGKAVETNTSEGVVLILSAPIAPATGGSTLGVAQGYWDFRATVDFSTGTITPFNDQATRTNLPASGSAYDGDTFSQLLGVSFYPIIENNSGLGGDTNDGTQIYIGGSGTSSVDNTCNPPTTGDQGANWIPGSVAGFVYEGGLVASPIPNLDFGFGLCNLSNTAYYYIGRIGFIAIGVKN